MKANQYLLQEGKIKEITRGRRSRENTAFLVEAVANGMKFDDFTPAETVNDKGETVVKNTAPRPGASHLENYAEVFVRYPGTSGSEYEANDVWKVITPDGKTLPTPNGYGGLRQICFNCGLSLVGHTCMTPEIIYNGEIVAVNIERR